MVPIEQQYQLFASAGAIRFPIDPVADAWEEKVCPVSIKKCALPYKRQD